MKWSMVAAALAMTGGVAIGLNANRKTALLSYAAYLAGCVIGYLLGVDL